MKRLPVFVGILVISALFIMCPKQEAPAAAPLQIQIQGHVYDSTTNQLVPNSYVGLYYQTQSDNGLPTVKKLVETRTDTGGFYSLQCSLDAEPCAKGAKLYLTSPADVHSPGNSIGCTNALQTIDLYK